MDFYRWRKTGAPKDQCQQHVVEAISDCFTPIAHEGRAIETTLAMFRYTAPLGTGAWTWLLKQAAKAVAVAEYETRRSQIRIADLSDKVRRREDRIRHIHDSTSWRVTAPLRRCAEGVRGILGRGSSSASMRRLRG